jgi:hypothetical protein
MNPDPHHFLKVPHEDLRDSICLKEKNWFCPTAVQFFVTKIRLLIRIWIQCVAVTTQILTFGTYINRATFLLKISVKKEEYDLKAFLMMAGPSHQPFTRPWK